MTQIITFYSYKGGVGRTMALVNAAYVLAREGYRVLMVDLDLEAPGMTHSFAESIRSQKSKGLRDSIDLLLEAKRTLAEADSSEQPPEISGSLEDFVVTVELPQEWRRTIPYLNGRLDLLPARMDSFTPAADLPASNDYLQRLDDLDLAGIFSQGGPRHRFGDHLREYFLQARFNAPGDPLFVMREEVRATYDVVLIDSRTGLNEISGLCVGPLCDGLVVCCGLNRQNIAGSNYFLEKVGLLENVDGKPYVVVAGPVPVWQKQGTRERISAIRQSLGRELVVEVPYHPAAALAETVFVTDTDEPEEAISAAYRFLAREIRRVFLNLTAHSQPQWLRLGWDALGGSQAAFGVVSYLRSRRVQSLERPGGSLCRFPTASAMAGMPSGDSPQPESYTISAAVASYWTGSDRAFRRAWDHLKAGVGHGSPRLSLAVFKLALLECRIFGVFKGLPKDIETVRSVGENRYQRDDLRLEYLLALHLLGCGDQETDKEILQLMQAWCSQPDFKSDWWGRYGVALLALLLASDLSRDQLRALERAVAKLPKELLTGDFSRPDPVPFGFWPESLLVSALSVVREGRAVGEVLDLIHVLRDRYGYAWRVLVDWRHLAKLKDHPLFQQFLREEDGMVEEIESAVDRGVYPL